MTKKEKLERAIEIYKPLVAFYEKHHGWKDGTISQEEKKNVEAIKEAIKVLLKEVGK